MAQQKLRSELPVGIRVVSRVARFLYVAFYYCSAFLDQLWAISGPQIILLYDFKFL